MLRYEKTAPSLRVGKLMSRFGVAQRLFGITKLRFTRLAPKGISFGHRAHLYANAGYSHSVNGPWEATCGEKHAF